METYTIKTGKPMKRRPRAIEVIPEKSPRCNRGVPLVSYPNAQFFVWDDKRKKLKPMEGKR